MEHKSFCRLAIKPIAYDGVAKAEGMGAMDTELMCAACYRPELEQSMSSLVCQHTIMRLCRLAVLRVNHLPRAVVDVGTKRQADVAFLSDGHLPLEQGMIDLMDAAMQEEVL